MRKASDERDHTRLPARGTFHDPDLKHASEFSQGSLQTGGPRSGSSEASQQDLNVSQLARKRLEETGLLESPEWSDFAGAPLVEDEVSVSVDGLTDPNDAFDLVQLTNKAGNVALVHLSKAGEFAAPDLDRFLLTVERRPAGRLGVALLMNWTSLLESAK